MSFARSVQAVLDPFPENQILKMAIRSIRNLLLPVMTNESALLLLKLRAFGSKQQTGTNYLLILDGKITCEACMKLVLGFFVTEVFGHNWELYPPFVSPPLDSISSPALLATECFVKAGMPSKDLMLRFPQNSSPWSVLPR